MFLHADPLSTHRELEKADFYLKKNTAFWRVPPESHFGHSFDITFFGLLI